MTDLSRALLPPADLVSFVKLHITKVGFYDPSEKQYLNALNMLAQPVDDRFDPIAPPRAVISRDISPKCIGIVHSANFRDPLLALQMNLANELVNLVVELQWCMELGPYYYSGGRIISKLHRFPEYRPTALHIGEAVARRRHILVVDDSYVSTQLVQFNLEQSGYETTIASDGYEALMKAQEQQFDLVLTDQQMPLMNGTELCKLLRTHDLYREIPIVLFTTTGELPGISELEEDFNIAVTVYKSLEPKGLLRSIDTLLSA